MLKNVSFIIPNYNGEKTISLVINSILNQNYKKGKKEIIVLDDKSKDNSLKVLQKYKGKIKLIKNEKNFGEVGSTNKGIKTAKYEIVCIILCDYVLGSKNWLRTMVDALNSSKDFGMVGTDVILPKNTLSKCKFWDKVVLSPVLYQESKGKIKKDRPVMFKKEVFKKLGLYDESYKMGADTDMRLKILKEGYKIANTRTKLLHYHGFYGLTARQQIFKKSLPLTEAAGVIFRRYGFVDTLYWGFWNPITSTILYLGLLAPYLWYMSLFFILLASGYYTFLSSKYNKDIRIILVPFFKIIKDVISLFGFWKGFLTNKQTF
ncbi:MAG: Glycosyltransferases involved in cell wall biogenesis [archaeon GW2011_AR20]|nr:MAG: Glycosyltransferases involved in cell wall biogenesis [archaeon GW2011_AR20]MBS3160491.1 glycosyltransferase [Candidatus Woesearchaeota archaeon]